MTLKTVRQVKLLAEEKVAHVVCGIHHTMALTHDGKVFAWGGSLH